MSRGRLPSSEGAARGGRLHFMKISCKVTAPEERLGPARPSERRSLQTLPEDLERILSRAGVEAGFRVAVSKREAGPDAMDRQCYRPWASDAADRHGDQIVALTRARR